MFYLIFRTSSPSNIIELRQSDFTSGTYRIRASGHYRLMEDIIFAPNHNVSSSTTPGADLNVLNNFVPTAAQIADQTYPAPPYQLGFFAAITVEANGVIIDLNGFSIRQHRLHNLQQKFYAHIELTSAPFIPSQGPSDFGDSIVKPEYVYIKNGYLGLSSHHGIHGNGMKNVIIENVTISDYEIGAIALNGGENILIRNVYVPNNSIKTQIIATYSHAIFIRSFLRALKTAVADASLNVNGSENKTITNIISALETEMITNVYEKVRAGEDINSTLFGNSSGLVDGGIYGLLFNPLGVAVEDFKLNRTGAIGNINICVHDIAINNLICKPKEISGLSIDELGTNIQKGTVGEVVRVIAATKPDEPNIGSYVSNVLADAWFILAKYNANRQFTSVGTLNIPAAMVTWVESAARSRSENISEIAGGAGKLKYINLHDSMFHVMKGSIPIFISAANNFRGKQILIDGSSNQGEKGDDDSNRVVDYNSIIESGGVNENLHFKTYEGNNLRNICISGSSNVTIDTVEMRNTSSDTGNCVGIDVIGSSDTIKIYNCEFTCSKSVNALTSSLKDRLLISDSSLPAALRALSNPILPNPESKTRVVNTEATATNTNIRNISTTMERKNPFGKRKFR